MSKARIPPAQEISPREKKEKMLAAAAKLFCNRGFKRTTLDQVAEIVSLTKPSLYPHFKNKKTILIECLEKALCEWKTVIANFEVSPLPLGDEAVNLAERYADVAFNDFGMCLMRRRFEYLGTKEQDILLRQKADIDVGFKALIVEGLRRQSRSDADPDFLWLMVTILVQGIALLERPVDEKLVLLSKALKAMLAG